MGGLSARGANQKLTTAVHPAPLSLAGAGNVMVRSGKPNHYWEKP